MFVKIATDCSTLCAITGIITFSSNCPACTAIATAASFPTT